VRNLQKYIALIVFIFPLIIKAQQAKPLQFKWTIGTDQKPTYNTLLFTKPATKQVMPAREIKYARPKTAVFCRMEEVFYKRFNVLFKVRMGTDDSYSN